MELSKKILVFIGIVIGLGLPISLWFVALVALLSSDLTIFKDEMYPSAITLVVLGGGGLLGIISLMAAPPTSASPLFGTFITVMLLLMGACALLLYAYLLVEPFHWHKLFALPLVFFVYMPMLCAAYTVYTFAPLLFGPSQN